MKTDKRGRVIIRIYPKIKKSELRPGDILLFYYGNKLTQFHGRWRKKKYGRSTLPPYHAAIVYKLTSKDVIILDPEISTSLSFLHEYLKKKNNRIDIVRFEASRPQRRAIQAKIKEIGTKEGFYDWKGYFAFISQMPCLGWLKVIKPSKKTFFCSDASTYAVHSSTNIRVSPRSANKTAPVDNQLYGLDHHKLYTVKKRGESYDI